MKAKLINKKTGEETLCDKVTINGFEYWVSDEKPIKSTKPCYCYNSIKNTWDADIVFYQGVMPMYHYEGFKIIVATNNPNIDIPKLVDEVEILAFDYYEQVKKEYYSTGQKTQLPKSNKEFQAMGDGFVAGYNKSQATHPNSDDDMVEFGEMVAWNMVGKTITESFVKGISKELLQLWKEQKIKTVYYES